MPKVFSTSVEHASSKGPAAMEGGGGGSEKEEGGGATGFLFSS